MVVLIYDEAGRYKEDDSARTTRLQSRLQRLSKRSQFRDREEVQRVTSVI